MAQHVNKKDFSVKTHWGLVILVALTVLLLIFFIFNLLFKNPVY